MTALVLAAVTLSACAPTPAPTPTAAFASEEEAFAAAEETYRAYNDAYNNVDYSDASTFTVLDSYTSGSYQAEEREGLSQMHADGVIREGEASIVWFRGIAFENNTTVRAISCKDLSGVNIYDEAGVSLVVPDRAATSAVELMFSIENSRLVLVDSQAVEDDSCVVS